LEDLGGRDLVGLSKKTRLSSQRQAKARPILEWRQHPATHWPLPWSLGAEQLNFQQALQLSIDQWMEATNNDLDIQRAAQMIDR
jgi:hypothetical protein